jgi:glycosyltransferase involved in cell wall biosynthesis
MKLSIITINRNNANGLKQTLISVQEQTYNEFEHIIIDGMSSDNSVDIIKSFPRISHYVSEPDNGIYDAMNKGIKQAKGEYCLFLNSGDYLASPTVLSEIDFSDEDIIYGDLIWKNECNKILHKKKPPALTIGFFVDNCLAHPSSFIKTSLLKQLGGYRTDLQIISDWAFFLEAIYKHGASYKHVPVFVSIFIKNGISSDPGNYALMQKERENVWKDLFPNTYKDILRMAELEKAWKIPGVKFLMKYIHPIYKKLRYDA